MPERDIPVSPFGSFVGLQVLEYGEGTCRCSLQLDETHQNTSGRVHGGVICTLADTASGFAVKSILEEGRFPATIDLNVSFTGRPRGDSLVATARVVSQGRSVLRCEVDVESDGASVARSYATFLALDPP